MSLTLTQNGRLLAFLSILLTTFHIKNDQQYFMTLFKIHLMINCIHDFGVYDVCVIQNTTLSHSGFCHICFCNFGLYPVCFSNCVGYYCNHSICYDLDENSIHSWIVLIWVSISLSIRWTRVLKMLLRIVTLSSSSFYANIPVASRNVPQCLLTILNICFHTYHMFETKHD